VRLQSAEIIKAAHCPKVRRHVDESDFRIKNVAAVEHALGEDIAEREPRVALECGDVISRDDDGIVVWVKSKLRALTVQAPVIGFEQLKQGEKIQNCRVDYAALLISEHTLENQIEKRAIERLNFWGEPAEGTEKSLWI
jgi:hypothetical protein